MRPLRLKPLASLLVLLGLASPGTDPWNASASRTGDPRPGASAEGWFLSGLPADLADEARKLPPPPAAAPIEQVFGTDGFWRLGKDQAGVWWFVSPDNRLEFLNAVTTVQPFQQARDPDGASFTSSDYIDPATGEPDLDRWAQRTLSRVRGVGFKSLGAWCHPIFHGLDVPMTRDLNLWTWVAPEHRRLYDPQWLPAVEQAVRQQVEPLRDNVNLLGYFTDNELDWGDKFVGPAVYFDYLPNDDPNRQVVLQTIRAIWPTVEAFNQDWETQLGSSDELANWQTLPHEPAPAYHRLSDAFRERVARDYFTFTSSLIRQHDPNHLILGVRFRGYAPLEVVRASRGLTEAQSLNYYVSDARLDQAMFEMMYRESGQPILVTEYSFHALDGRSGNRNSVGFAAQVPDQEARAEGYRAMTSRLARVPYVVAADWFQWMDEPPSGRSADGEDVNFGVVDIDDEPYETLRQAIRETAASLNGMHAISHGSSPQELWRKSFAARPVLEIPYLAKPPVLNGQLADWPAASVVTGINLSQTIGLDRTKLKVPVVKVGWNERGLYLGIAVFDNDIDGAPADGWWWTRDCVEFWVSTRPTPEEQTEYDLFSHQFFFVPVSFPGKDGRSGVVGQWKRPGDALDANLIPHPKVVDAVRILPDRYVVEMLIPAEALNGWDPTQHPELAFNLYVRNFHQATEYFWSAPKEVMTQFRPNTWGIARLTRADGSGAAVPRQVDASARD